MNILLKFQLPSSSGLGLTVFPQTMSYWINELMTGGDCRTAPATPGLLNMVDGFVYNGFVVLFNKSYKGG